MPREGELPLPAVTSGGRPLNAPASPVPSLGRRLTRRAIDLLVVGFVLTVGMSVGQQLIEWWRTDPNSLTPDFSGLTAVDLDWNHTPVTLRFGDSATAMERRPFRGLREQLEEELTRIGQSMVATSQAPSQPADEAEQGWLTDLEAVPAVFWDSSEGNVYRRGEPLPSFVATRFINDPNAADAGKQRIVGWGLAFPTSPGDWTIYVFRPDASRPTIAQTQSIALPESARNITDLSGADGCQWQVIQGRGDIAGWVQHFEVQYGPTFVVSKSVETQTANLKVRRDQIVTDIQFRREPDDRLTAVIWSAPERKSQ